MSQALATNILGVIGKQGDPGQALVEIKRLCQDVAGPTPTPAEPTNASTEGSDAEPVPKPKRRRSRKTEE